MASERFMRQLGISTDQIIVNVNHEQRIRELEKVIRWQSWWLAILMLAIAVVAFSH